MLLFYTYARGVDSCVFAGKVNIWNVKSVCEQQHLFLTRGGPCASVEVFETENVSTQRGFEPPTSGFMPNPLPVELPGSANCYPMFWNTGSGGIAIFVYKASS